jgi:hypothetical protein
VRTVSVTPAATVAVLEPSASARVIIRTGGLFPDRDDSPDVLMITES